MLKSSTWIKWTLQIHYMQLFTWATMKCVCVCVKPLVYIDRSYSQAKQRILICKYKDTCGNRTLTVYKPYLFLFPANRDAFVLIFQGVLCSFSIFSLELSSMVVASDQSADRPPLMLLVDAENGGWRCCTLWFSATGKKRTPWKHYKLPHNAP